MEIRRIASLALNINSQSMNTRDAFEEIRHAIRAGKHFWWTKCFNLPFEQTGLHISSYQSPKLGIVIEIWKWYSNILAKCKLSDRKASSVDKKVNMLFPFWYLRLLALFIWHNLIKSRGNFSPSATSLPVVLLFLWSKEKEKKGTGREKDVVWSQAVIEGSDWAWHRG